MRKFLSVFIGCVSVLAVDAALAATGRVGVERDVIASPRMPTMAVSTVGVTTSISKSKLQDKVELPDVKPDDKPDVKPDDKPDDEPAKDTREKERTACIRNNIGVGNTFVWASRYSDINNYATMVEDIENPENNTCFVLVGVKSSDSRIDLSDLPSKYFEMGRNITCASWVDEDEIESRILDAKKKNRTLATIGGAVGGAALGVGSMELFGNRAIGGSVMGQKALEGKELIRSQLLVMKKNDTAQFNKLMDQIAKVKEMCKGTGNKYDECTNDKTQMFIELSEEL